MAPVPRSPVGVVLGPPDLEVHFRWSDATESGCGHNTADVRGNRAVDPDPEYRVSGDLGQGSRESGLEIVSEPVRLPPRW